MEIGTLVLQFFEDNLSQPITLNDVSAHFGVGVSTLTRLLRNEGQTGAMATLHRLRMERAAALLLASSDSVRSIARQVGIPDPSYFNHCFHKHFGQSPGAYRG